MNQRIMWPTTRLCAALGLAVATWGAQAADTTRVIVSYQSAESAASVRAAAQRLGGVLKVDLGHVQAMAVEVPTARLAALRKLPGVVRVEVDQKRELVPHVAATVSADEADAAMDALRGEGALRQRLPYGIKQAQGKNVPGSSADPITVCIIDTGLDRTHPDLPGASATGSFDPGGSGNWYDVDNPHGTHVAGTVAALDNNLGVIGIAGRGEVRLHIVKVFTGDAWSYSSTLSAATQECKAAGAKVISMSLRGLFPNSAERENFAQLERDGLISVAAAGNDGAQINGYPASYPSVISVAAVDINRNWASFSNRNGQVELAAAGVNVASTLPVGAGGLMGSLRQAGAGYASIPLEGSPQTGADTPVIAATYDFGLGDAVDTGAAGKMCVILRGVNSLSAKVLNCQDSGGVAAVIYNNVPGNFNGTLGGVATTIPSVSISDVDGVAMKAAVPAAARMRVAAVDYGYLSGTSMSTPHVSGVAAKLWRLHPECSNIEIRSSLDNSALDLGDPGRDARTGFGLVQLRTAHERINTMGCGN